MHSIEICEISKSGTVVCCSVPKLYQMPRAVLDMYSYFKIHLSTHRKCFGLQVLPVVYFPLCC